eukprot:TRINITY_DN7602_c0_g1_i1.p3 TRINITY_DN7602_c0_g1~~TRINITY_DN7602_c0_g1_i1.p3  ORF type:complete len:52 (+),score=4.89 TRINITY_DN7602_c0_g1_i1:42-197(+)
MWTWWEWSCCMKIMWLAGVKDYKHIPHWNCNKQLVRCKHYNGVRDMLRRDA